MGATPLSIPELVAIVVRRLPELADQARDAVLSENSGYQGVVDPDELRSACIATMEAILTRFAGQKVRREIETIEEVLGERRAEQGVAYDAFMSACRRDFQILWEAILDEARAHGEASTEILLDSATLLWQIVEQCSTRCANAYQRRQTALARRNEIHRDALLASLFDGRRRAAPHEVARAFDLPELGRFVVVSVDGEAGPTAAVDALRSVLAPERLRSVWLRRVDHAVGLILRGNTPYAHVVSVLRGVREYNVGVSPSFDGLAAASLGYQYADLARWTVTDACDPVVLLDERLPEALLIERPEISSRLVKTVLGPVPDLPREERDRLVNALTVFLESSSVAETATKLYCHRNTVLSRLQEWKRLTHRDPRHPRDAAQLYLGLRALAMLERSPRGRQSEFF